MRKWISLSCLSMVFFLNGSLGYAVDIFRTLYVPEIKGLTSDPIPLEIDKNNIGKEFKYSLTTSALDALLQDAHLPQVCDLTKEERQVPQCRVTTIARTATYGLSVRDREWLKKQSGWCRFTRKLWGGCNPGSLEDIMTLSLQVRNVEPETQKVTGESIEKIESSSCMADPQTPADKVLDTLKVCAVSASPYQEDCVRYFKDARLIYKDKLWTIALSPVSETKVRAVLPPLKEEDSLETKLEAVSISGIDLSPKPVQSWNGAMGLLKAFDLFKEPQEVVGVSGKYSKIVNATQKTEEVLKAQLPVSKTSRVIENFPSEVSLSIGDILGFEKHEVTPDAAQSIKEVCSAGGAKSDFEKFVCDEVIRTRGADSLAQKQITLRFQDQKGVMRFLTWESNPTAICSVRKPERYRGEWYSRGSFSCTVEPNREAWEAWIRDDSPMIERFLIDSSECCQKLVFTIHNFIPRNSLGGFVDAQSHEVRLIHKE